MNRPDRPRLIQVQSRRMLGKNMCRITFSGPELADYPCESNGVPFKLLLPRSGQAEPQMPEGFENGRPKWRDPSAKPYSRTYTIRRFDAGKCLLEVDFVLHGDNGPAAAFAARPNRRHHRPQTRQHPETGCILPAGRRPNRPARHRRHARTNAV